jgi:8-oxo-dGTP pyrophosphatase MutT (NUDIX family)
MNEARSGSSSRHLVSCGVIVTDRLHILMGHATLSPRWDVPKGVGEPDETYAQTAQRELLEETGLVCPPEDLKEIGLFPYLKGKDLALFTWYPARMPDPATLFCASTFCVGGKMLPEFDKFAIFTWDEALTRVGKNLARILGAIAPTICCRSSSTDTAA